MPATLAIVLHVTLMQLAIGPDDSSAAVNASATFPVGAGANFTICYKVSSGSPMAEATRNYTPTLSQTPTRALILIVNHTPTPTSTLTRTLILS